MTKCKVCSHEFPDHLIQTGYLNGEALVACPLCQLWARNALHGLPQGTPFNGEIAQSLVDEATEYLRGGKAA